MNTLKNLAVVTGCVLAGYLLSLAGREKPSEPVEATPVSVEAPADKPVVPTDNSAAEADIPATETNNQAAPADRVTAPCQHCGGDGLLDGPYGPLLCPTCGKGKSSQIPTFVPPTLYTQPQEAPKAVPTEYVTVQQSYRYGMFGRRTGYRNVTMTRAQYEARRGQAAYYGGCAGGWCGR